MGTIAKSRRRENAADRAQRSWVNELFELSQRLGDHGLWAPTVVVRTWSARQVRAAQVWAADASIARLAGKEAPERPPHVAALEASEAVLARLERRRRLTDLAVTANRNGGFA